MPYFIDVILPLPLPKLYTYQITEAEKQQLHPGMRVALPFGKQKIHTAIVEKIHSTAPQLYTAKPIFLILEEQASVTTHQLQFWKWMSNYYLCSQGAIAKAALPSPLLLESETILVKKETAAHVIDGLSDELFLVYEALLSGPLKIEEIVAITERKKVMPLVQELISLGVIELQQQLKERFKPKYVHYVKLHENYASDTKQQELFEQLKKAPKQRQCVLAIFEGNPTGQQWQKVTVLKKRGHATSAVIRTLVDKGILEEQYQQEERVLIKDYIKKEVPKELSNVQKKSIGDVETSFLKKDVVLLEGVTGSGKTEIYIQLIQKALDANKQVLYLLPEISLTSQIVMRLMARFGDRVTVFHSKFTLQERTEVWNRVLHHQENAQIIVGARSALLLPFKRLGLIIVDEEHEPAFKQFDPAPRYHARDSAIVLAKLMDSKVLLGSATPSLDSSYNARNQKFGWVQLKQRFGGVSLPKIATIDLKESFKKKQMKGSFSFAMIKEIEQTLAAGKQVLLFQNRRGYAPILECISCGHTPQCTQCDVSLSYHQISQQLKCHYCGYSMAKPQHCHACGSATLNTKGVGTQQVEEEMQTLFPKHTIGRMDWDSTRGKWGFEKIIRSFEQQEIDILVGTQMIVKGLDFKNVHLVGVLNTDALLNFPDFRAHERAYQLLLQVAGRSGRAQEQGNVLLQTYQPTHPILRQVMTYNYDAFYEAQLSERMQYGYPPYVRMIRITCKHKNFDTVNKASEWFANVLKQSYQGVILGPAFPPIARVRNLFQKQVLLKFEGNVSRKNVKALLLQSQKSFEAISGFKSVRLFFDVDPF